MRMRTTMVTASKSISAEAAAIYPVLTTQLNLLPVLLGGYSGGNSSKAINYSWKNQHQCTPIPIHLLPIPDSPSNCARRPPATDVLQWQLSSFEEPIEIHCPACDNTAAQLGAVDAPPQRLQCSTALVACSAQRWARRAPRHAVLTAACTKSLHATSA